MEQFVRGDIMGNRPLLVQVFPLELPSAFMPMSPTSNDNSAGTTACEDDALLRALIARMGDGDEAALGQLYDRTSRRVYGFALRVTRSPEMAEEVVEEVFWQAWRQALRFDPARGNPMAWLMTMTRSRALDALRRIDDAELHPEPETLMAAETACGGDPQNLLEAVQRHHALHAALESLDALPRQLLSLAFFRGLTHEEIALQSSLPLGTVKSHIRRALTALGKVLPPDMGALDTHA
ncbi:MAG: sigma-70 family RNA polymerase sigma factor [Methyloversatilis sp.]|jgi:RNA polymerase sigma factor (sigma-70 family)|nr:sigma-70 family RNA polymerase sigma factor [Methyloversatilis sp.]MBP6193274.1 sigma-70 family RNA polymerase sigma factor [Methyloversatilis sp.]MBP9117233.1 sigma-70 family RNA polymerase sigma factor [Methyloversatilis sp.]